MYTKVCFKMKEILDFNISWNFQPIWICFGNIIRKKISLACIYKLCFCWHNEILKIYDLWLNHQSFLSRSREVSLAWFLLASVLNQRWEHGQLLSKWKPCHKSINSRSRNLRVTLERYVQFHWNWNNHRLKRWTSCQIAYTTFKKYLQ